ncbi:MAG: tryptophan synthase subunit alpha [Candidatus Ancillula sp.]|jgi:tryptophan synthase alpha chain|nr:tryptophan synthase subunit alpha [Candidatus Ancillula sp.]
MTKFIAYLPIGFPNYEQSIEGFKTLINAGADILELGVPYSDPVMDGETIQNASAIAIQAGFKMRDVFKAVHELREYADQKYKLGETRKRTEVYLMSYYNMVLKYGLARFANDLHYAGGAGTIVPDLIPDEADTWMRISRSQELNTVFLTAPNSSDERLDVVAQNSTGFVYASSLLGVTGARDGVDQFSDAQAIINRVKSALRRHNKDTPVYLGLGVSSGTQAASIASFADGVIVGSRFVKALDISTGELMAVASSIKMGIIRGQRRGFETKGSY